MPLLLAGGGTLGISGGSPVQLYAVGRTVVNVKDAPYSAPGNGNNSGTEDLEAFNDYADWAVDQAGALVLYVPPGQYDVGSTLGGLFSSGYPLGVVTPPYRSPRDLKVFAPGATINAPTVIGTASGLRGDNYRVDTVLGGARTVHFVTPGEAVNFVEDINGDPLRWACMTALDLQAPSLPTNCQYFEYCEIESVDTVANTVTFVEPLTRSYKSTYPTINWYQALSDGPATIYPMDPRWDMALTIEGVAGNLVQFTQATQCYTNGRDITLRYVHFTGDGNASGGSKRIRVEDSILGENQNEWDKLLTELVIRRCSGYYLTFQSSTVFNADIDGLTLDSDFSGTPYNLVLRNADIAGTLNVGPNGYGISNSVTVEDSSFSVLAFLRNTLPIASFTSSTGGVLVRPLHIDDVDRPISWAVEGARLYIHNSSDTCLGYYGTVTDIRQNGSNIEVVTDAAGAIPTITGTFPSVSIGTVGCGSFSMTNCTGCEDALAWSLAPAGLLPGEFYRRTYDGSVRQPTGQQVWGKLVSISVNVTQAYTGPESSCLLNVGSRFGAAYILGGTDAGWAPVLNLKIAGLRTYTPGGGLVGGQAGDNFPALDPDAWLVHLNQYFATDITGESAGARPIVTIEAIFDQGV